MKYPVYITALMLLIFSACKTPYRATDPNAGSVDSTMNQSDTVSMNRTPGMIDSVNTQQDSTVADSVANMPQTNPDVNRQIPDSAGVTNPDPSMSQNPDSAKIDNNMTSSFSPPAGVEANFTKQYPKASDVAWSAYDSLASVPIDLRLTGWKKMDSDDVMVKFQEGEDTYYAWYDQDGNWIGSASPLKDFTKLPAAVNQAVQNAIRSRYNDYNVSQVNREFEKGKTKYEVELTSGEQKVRMMVGSDGKISEIYRYTPDNKNK